MNRRRPLYILVGVIGSLSVFLFCVILFSYQQIQLWGNKPLSFSTLIEIELERGESLGALAIKLENHGVIESPVVFKLWVRLFSDYSRYQAGHYQFQPHTTPSQIDTAIRRGDIYEPVVLEMTIPEGFTKQQILARAVKSKIGTLEELEHALTAENWHVRYPRLSQPASSLEGYLFPATYRFTTFPSPNEFISTLLNTFFEKLPADYISALETMNFSLQEAVTMASLIERETNRNEERQIVSEVIHNRLRKRIALGIDATIIYGLKDFDGNLRYRHLNDKTNKYNTRIHLGLPPTPICSPGLHSLKAVITPTHHGFLYYVVDANDFSRHRFTKKLSEHNRNVEAYWRARKKADIISQKPVR